MIFKKYTEVEIRSFSRQTLETLEIWLRQVVDESMTKKFGANYFDEFNNVLTAHRIKKIHVILASENTRYTRLIDALLLDDIITLICHQKYYDTIFKNYFIKYFPNGVNELRSIFKRLVEPRNRLSHANPITHRQAQQVICYSNDIIDSIKSFYLQNSMHEEFNVPRFTRFIDSFGNEIHFDKNIKHAQVTFTNQKASYLRPGDTLEIEIEIDSSFSDDEYTITWSAIKKIPDFGNTKKISLIIEDHHIGIDFSIQCRVISNKPWHRLQQGVDDILYAWYKVLQNF